MVAVELRNLTLTYPSGVTALADVSLSIAAGEWLCLLGPSGCGKTTLIRLLAGLEAPSGGRILFNGRDAALLPPHARGVALARQEAALYPQWTVARNLAFAATASPDRQDAIFTALTLAPLFGAYPGQLSGGQRQRVALARALLRGASLLLLDEPLAQLDAPARAEIRARLPLLRGAPPPTIVHVTHDLDEAQGLADRVALLDGGRLQRAGPVADILPRPDTPLATS